MVDVLDEDFSVVEPIGAFLEHLTAIDRFFAVPQPRSDRCGRHGWMARGPSRRNNAMRRTGDVPRRQLSSATVKEAHR
ncbi:MULTISPECIES: hypothetical protein [unclassified Rhodococcus (in: high G+C Gram-positive bacteria)]|uniref:hypothetical protein n=1 Tax=unclassified Rhodococcus (in: high G+C Gram-positive bacteria) TaxID=192944 RepID=UPI000BE42BEF|nr:MULTISPECIES: hypothetical protein [unclassified Rhodococcus (in: high G+C Gram-positive bacteria)]MBP1162123.1 hypothetical protein [Rhodococcus sp. PvR099]